MAGNSAVRGQTVTAKVMSVLRAFAGERSELSLSELSRATGLPSSTVHRLAQELVACGGLERTRLGHYVVGIHLWEIAARSVRGSGLRQIAMPFLQSLYDATHQHVQLAVLDGSDALLVEKISRPGAIPTVGRVGGRLPLHASAIGKALLAHAPRDYQEHALRSDLIRYTPKTITSGAQLRQELAQVRLRGIALSTEEMTNGVVSCAAVIHSGGERGSAALSIVMPAGRGEFREFECTVMAAARGVAHALEAGRPSCAMSAPFTGLGARVS